MWRFGFKTPVNDDDNGLNCGGSGVMDVRVDITANHKGWFEFRLCPHNDPSTPITQQCLDQYLLQMADGSGTRYQLGGQTGYVDLKLKLPAGLTCSQCVLQWKYHGEYLPRSWLSGPVLRLRNEDRRSCHTPHDIARPFNQASNHHNDDNNHNKSCICPADRFLQSDRCLAWFV
nr:hypothetical protein BaRGS_009818 [Batillaria attramentaria]